MNDAHLELYGADTPGLDQGSMSPSSERKRRLLWSKYSKSLFVFPTKVKQQIGLEGLPSKMLIYVSFICSFVLPLLFFL